MTILVLTQLMKFLEFSKTLDMYLCYMNAFKVSILLLGYIIFCDMV